MPSTPFWEFPQREVDDTDRMIVGSANANSASVPVRSTVQKAVATAPVRTTPPTSQTMFVQQDADGALIRRSALLASLGLPLAGESSRGLVTASEREKLNQLLLAAQVPSGGEIGQVLTKTGPGAFETGWTNVQGGGGGGSYSFINVGTGTAIFKQVSGSDVQLRTLAGASQSVVVSIAPGSNNNVVQIDVPPATSNLAGLMSAADKAKLDGLPSGFTPPPIFSGSSPGLVPSPPSQPANPNLALHADGQWKLVSGGGSINFGEPPSSPSSNPVSYGRAFVDGVGQWRQVVEPDHTHEFSDLSDVVLTGSPTNALLVWTGTTVTWRPKLATTELADVASSTPADGNVLAWNAATQRYIPTSVLAATQAIPVRSEIAGPVETPFISDMIGKLTPVNLSAGDVQINLLTDISHAASTVLYAQFRILPTVGSGAKLRFRSPLGTTEPTLHAHYLGGRGTNSSSSAISTWYPESSDRHTISIPAGDNMTLMIAVSSHPATLGTARTLTTTLDGTSITLDSSLDTDAGFAAGGWRYYSTFLGTKTSPSTAVLRFTGGTNVCCYNVQMMVFANTPSTGAIGDITHNQYPTSTTQVTYSATSSGPNKLLTYCISRVNASGSTAPTTSGATQIAWTNINTGTNRGASTHLIATEEVSGSGSQNCTVTWSAALNSVALTFTVSGTASSGQTMNIRTANNVAPDIGTPNELVTVIYDANNSEALVVF